jgi:WD40 repeat protein
MASVHALKLAEGVSHMVWLTKTKIAIAAAIVAMTVAAGGTGVWMQQTWKTERQVVQVKEGAEKDKRPEPEKPKEKPPEPPLTEEEKPKEDEEKRDPNDRFSDPLPFGAIARMGAVRLRVDTPFQALTFSNDDKMLAAITGKRKLSLWQMPTGKLLWVTDLWKVNRDFSKDAKIPPAKWPLLFSPDGTKLVTPVAIYDTESGKPIKELMTGKGLIATAAFSPNGKELALSWTGSGMSFLNTRSSKEERLAAEKIPDAASAFSFSPDGETLAVLAPDPSLAEGRQAESIYLFDLSEKGKIMDGRKLAGPFRCFLFSTDGKKLYAAKGRDIHVLDPEDPKEQKKTVILKGHNSSIVSLAPGPEKDSFVSVSIDDTVGIWSEQAGEKSSTLKFKNAMAPSLAFAHDRKTVAFVAKPGVIQFGNFKTGEVKPAAEGHLHALNSLSFSPDGRTLASCSSDREIRFWNPSTGMERIKRMEIEESVKHLSWSPDGKTLATIGDADQPRLWDVLAGKEKEILQQQKHGVRALAFSPMKQIIAIARLQHPIELIDAETGELRVSLQKRRIGVDGGTCVTFSPNGNLIAAGTEPTERFLQPREGLIGIWDAETGKLLHEFGGQPSLSFYRIRAVSFTPDSKGLVYCDDNQLVLCDVSTGRPYRRFEGHDKEIICLALSPDGRTLASASQDGTFRLWEVLTGREIRRFDGHADKVYCLAFSPDGKRLASGSADTTALVWDVYGAIDVRRPLRDQLIPQVVEEYWADLARSDAGSAFQAIAALTAARGPSLPFIKEKMKEYHPPDVKRIDQLFRDLVEELPPECDQAYQELLEVGNVPEAALRKALQNSPSEILRKRLDKLLEYHEMGAQIVPSGKRLQVLRGLAVLEVIGNAQAKAIVESLAKGNAKDPVVREAKAVLERMRR